MLTLEQALASLESGLQPLPCLEDFAYILHKIKKERNHAYALRLHAHMRSCGLEAHPSLGNDVVSTLVAVGSMHNAQQVFDRLVYRNECSWNSLITGYARCGEPQHALILFQKMVEDDSIHPDGHTFVALLKACANLKDLDTGHKLHAEIARNGLLERHSFVGSTLVDMYAKFGLLSKAQEVFDKLPVRNVVSWTALIAGYTNHGRGEEALKCFEQMQLQGISPNAVTYVCCLKACGCIRASGKGQEIHAQITREGLLESKIDVGNALIDMYAKCGLLAKAQEVFMKLPVRDVVSWTALIAGYAKHGHGEEALNFFGKMQHEGVSPNSVTFVCALEACVSIGATDKAREIHVEIAKKGLLKGDIVVGNALVDMYAKCGFTAEAHKVLEKLPVRDVASWTALIAGYIDQEHGEEALNCFEQMQHEGISPDAVTYVWGLKACGSIGATDKGREIYAEIARTGLLEVDIVVGNALVNMYAECGLPAKAQEVFDMLPVRDTVSWTSLIAGYAQLGESENVFLNFDRMLGEDRKPNLVTFVSVLNACSHAGLVDEGQMYFEAMSRDYSITPTLEHYACMVDLLGRAGQLDKMVALIKKMVFYPDLVVWHTVLGACQKWGNMELGRHAFEHAVQLDEKDAGAYAFMSNIYRDAGMQAASKVEAMRLKNQAWKKPKHTLWVVTG